MSSEQVQEITREMHEIPTPQPLLFVTVGSTDFDPLVRKMDALFPDLQTQGGIMQIGHGRYVPTNAPYFRFAPTLDPYYAQAALVVAHGGLAVTMEVLARGLPLVSVSNADRYDQHQAELLKALADEGYLLWCRELDDLGQAIHAAQTQTLRPYALPDCTIHHDIEAYLGKFTGTRSGTLRS